MKTKLLDRLYSFFIEMVSVINGINNQVGTSCLKSNEETKDLIKNDRAYTVPMTVDYLFVFIKDKVSGTYFLEDGGCPSVNKETLISYLDYIKEKSNSEDGIYCKHYYSAYTKQEVSPDNIDHGVTVYEIDYKESVENGNEVIFVHGSFPTEWDYHRYDIEYFTPDFSSNEISVRIFKE